MEHKKITIATPHRNDFTDDYVISLIKMLAYSKHIIAPYFMRSDGILGHTRSDLLMSNAFDHDYVLFIDSDTEFMPHSLDQIVSHDKDIISGVVYMGTYPHAPAVFMKHYNGMMGHMWDIPQEVFKADAVGAAFLLVSRKVIDAFRESGIKPFSQVDNFSEDISFCLNAKALGFDVWVDPQIYTGHQKVMTIGKETYMQTREAEKDSYEKLKSEHPDFAARLCYV